MEHPVRVRAEACAEEHVADLRHRRVRDHALDVDLNERDQSCKEQRPRAEARSQVWSGNCADFATAPPSSPSATRFATVELYSPPRMPNSSEPAFLISRKNASAIVASPIAFMTNAFFAAAIALGRSCQKPIRRYEESPTIPQPASRSSRLPP